MILGFVLLSLPYFGARECSEASDPYVGREQCHYLLLLCRRLSGLGHAREPGLNTVYRPMFASLNCCNLSEPASFTMVEMFVEHRGHTYTLISEIFGAQYFRYESKKLG